MMDRIEVESNMVWWYFLEGEDGTIHATHVQMNEEEVRSAQGFLDDHDIPMRWHPMEPD